MKLSRLKLLYLVSAVLLATLAVFTVFRPVASQAAYSEVQELELLHVGDGWMLQFVIANNEGRDINYLVKTSAPGFPEHQTISVGEGRRVGYLQYVRPDELVGKKLDFAVYREGESRPIEQATYHLE